MRSRSTRRTEEMGMKDKRRHMKDKSQCVSVVTFFLSQ